MNQVWMHKNSLVVLDRAASARWRILWHASGFFLALPVFLTATLVSPGRQLWFPCKFKELANLPCPTCGFTRSFLRMGHGQYLRAFVTSPLAAILFVCLVFFMAVNLAALLLGTHIKPGPFFQWGKKGWFIFTITCLSLMAADWIYRCFHGLN